MTGVGISDSAKTDAEDVKAASSGSYDSGEYGVVQQDRVLPHPSNERKPITQTHGVGTSAFWVGRKEC